MKKITFIIIGLIAQSVWSQSSPLTCAPTNQLVKSATDTKAVACEEINKNGQCKQVVPVDPDAMRKKIESYFKITENPAYIEKLRMDWDQQVKSAPAIAKFYAERDSVDKENKVAPVPVLKWFSDPTFANLNQGQEDYKKAFIEKYVAFSQKHDCTPTFNRSSSYVESHPTIKEFSSKGMSGAAIKQRLQQMKAELNDPKNIQALNERMKKINDESLDRFYVCTSRPDLDGEGQIPGYLDLGQRHAPCAGNFKKNFMNNKHDVNETELATLLKGDDAQAVSECIKERLSRGATIHHISITSSASALNNTNEAEQRFCKKGFLALSEARAETARNKILPGLFDQAGQSGFDFSRVEIKTNAKGSNGDGTSGDCPYVYKNGIEIPKPYYATKAGQEELDENRFVKVQVTFNESSVSQSSNVKAYQPRYRCKKIELKCE